jgi:Domain of unknown function (DUF4440)
MHNARQNNARLQHCSITKNGGSDGNRSSSIGIAGACARHPERRSGLCKAQIAANAEVLATLCAAELSYSHSDGRVEDKATFIANATNGKSKVLSLEYQDTKVAIVGPAAIVRFHWVGEAEAVADGKKSSTNLHILMNWQKQGADWKLLSRASTKL